MTEAHEAQLSPETVLQEMKQNGVTHVVWLPDSETNWLYLLMQAEPSLQLVAVSREGLAFSIAAGLSVGGKTPIILIQNTGDTDIITLPLQYFFRPWQKVVANRDEPDREYVTNDRRVKQRR